MEKRLDVIVNHINMYFNKQILKMCFITTFVIGIIAHGFVFINSMYVHDSVSYKVSKNIINGIINGSARTTPFDSLWTIFSTECRTVWLSGIIILICYSFSSYFVCDVLKIEKRIFVFLVSGIMVVTPTTIAANTYGVDSGNALTLLFSSLAAFFFFKNGVVSKILFFISIIITIGSYGPFISFVYSIVLIRLYCDFYNRTSISELVKKIVYISFCCAVGVIIVLLLSMSVTRISNNDLQGRVSAVLATNINSQVESAYYCKTIIDTIVFYIDKVLVNTINTLLFFLPQGVSYRLGIAIPANSFFVENRILLYTFYVSILFLLYSIIREAIDRKKKSIIIAFIVMVILQFITMDIYGSITWSHLLMRYSFISPWLFVIAVANLSDFMKVRNKVDVSNFKIIACIMGFTTIISGIYLANEVYAKEEATYKSGLLLANRVADHLESIEGYVPGETKVFIVGNLRYNYAPVREEFSFVRDFTNIGSPIWDTAITQYWSLMGFLDNQIAIDVNYAVTPPFEYEYYAEGYADILSGGGYEFDRNDFICKYEVTDSFPSYDCYFWCGDILVFKLSERK